MRKDEDELGEDEEKEAEAKCSFPPERPKRFPISHEKILATFPIPG